MTIIAPASRVEGGGTTLSDMTTLGGRPSDPTDLPGAPTISALPPTGGPAAPSTPPGGPGSGESPQGRGGRAKPRRGPRAGLTIAAALLVFVTVVLVLFVLFNTQTVDISLVFGDVQAPLVVALVLAAALGGLLVGLAGVAVSARRSSR